MREIAPIGVGIEDLPLFLPSSTRDMERELADILASVCDPALLALLARLLGPETPTGPGFRMAPAATRNRHAWLGGLLEHTLSVARLCDSIAAHYGPGNDLDAKLNRSRTPAANPLAAASPGPARGTPTPQAPRPDATRRDDDTLDLFAWPAAS
jgi:hypothetical protein